MSNVAHIPLLLVIYQIEAVFVKLLAGQHKLYNFNTFTVTNGN